MSQAVLMKEYKALAKEKWVEIEVSNSLQNNAGASQLLTWVQVDEDNMYHWNLALMVINPDSMYYGGYFKAQMTFPRDYPYKPPGRIYVGPL
jgi:ubiquitin-conjugating enzyme E2 R